MKTIRLLLFLISFLGFSQENIKKNDSIKVNKYKPNLFISFDVFGLSKSFFNDSKKYQSMINFRLTKNLDFSGIGGVQTGIYDKLQWNVKSEGIFIKTGINYKVVKDYENSLTNFYIGTKLGTSFFNQTINQYPIYGYRSRINPTEISYGSFPTEKVNAFWLEFVLGIKVQLRKSRFYLVTELQPSIILSSKNSQSIESLFIPGIGRNKEVLNFDIFTGIGFKL